MKTIIKEEFGGERPLYEKTDLELKEIIIHAGESGLKECKNIIAKDCRFEGKYPFWCCSNLDIKNCIFTAGARAAIWYTKDISMSDCIIDAPKMFRETENLCLENIQIPAASETLWHCRNIKMNNVIAERADYILMKCTGGIINNFKLDGNYSFQWSSNIEIHNSILNTRDAFWETENVSVYDSVINGEFLGWHSRNLKLVRCHIGGIQPLCYAENLILEDCTFAEDANLAFEYSNVQATIKGHIHSIRNPKSGFIKADSIGEVILNEYIKHPGNCKITQN